MGHQPFPVLGKNRWIKRIFHQVHIQKPAIKQVIVSCSQICRSLRTEYKAINNRDFKIRSGGIEGRPVWEYI